MEINQLKAHINLALKAKIIKMTIGLKVGKNGQNQKDKEIDEKHKPKDIEVMKAYYENENPLNSLKNI